MPLPNFLIIGAAKAGTTSLWHYCGEHPQIFVSRVKECNFFCHRDGHTLRPGRQRRFGVSTPEEYQRLFDDVRGEIAIGEASPHYLRSPVAPDRIRSLLPGVRLVASLREPASTVYSAYLMHVRQGKADPDAAVAFGPGSRYYRSGFYFNHLKRYYDLFGREQMYVCLFDDLARDAAATMAGLYRFLGVDPDFRPNIDVRHNVGAVPKSDWLRAVVTSIARRELGQHLPPWLLSAGRRLLLREAPRCPADLRERLRRVHREDVLKVQDLIQRDLSAWLT
jgi:hypothetical protein